MSTSAQRNYIGHLLYKSGVGFNNSSKIAEYCEAMDDYQADTIIKYLKNKGIENLELYEDDEVVPERIKDIFSESFITN